jgi:predicted  nucleic acid-binding Zn-ribbon protein
MSSGRIEIPMDEYKGMKEKIDSLEKALVSKDKEIEVLKNSYIVSQNNLEDIARLSFFERVFNWKSNIRSILSDE